MAPFVDRSRKGAIIRRAADHVCIGARPVARWMEDDLLGIATCEGAATQSDKEGS